MLSLLHIENIAVIERADIEFENGLTVLTGETGAGKSIIIDSIGAIMGQRTNRSLIRSGAEKGFVSAVFTELAPELVQWLHENQLDSDENDTLHIQRQISPDGKSVCRVNMKPVSVSTLKQISPYLINIHGQHDGQKLMDESCHIDFLDSFANIDELLKQYQPCYHKLLSLKRQINALDKSEQERLQRVDMLTFHLQEIDEAQLKEGEDEKLSERKAFFDNVGRLVNVLEQAYSVLDGADEMMGACELLSSASNALGSLADVSTELSEMTEKAEEVKYLAIDLRDSIAQIRSRTEFSPEERTAIEERLDLIYRLKLKYGAEINDILAYAESARNELETLESADEQRSELLREYKELREHARELARKISSVRREAATKLEKAIVSELVDLDMNKVRLAVRVETGTKLAIKGFDSVEFQISVNVGEPLRGLSKVASGGELSRVMLAMKNVLTANESVGTLIFDEIDTGVSGRAAQKIAHKLAQIGDKKQTLCVTHLPQIAAMGKHHMLIYKSVRDDRTYTDVCKLDENKRVEEIARMISGDCITDTSRNNALELIKKAGNK
ncbi:MAG TPA: DNA repair protein RecN [Candidatus Butyricicoccus avistercoris]|uniref:DNA repair protein RecN n=1 Tax=Candidatus Butyricicoccus avistercoris TaxID=2838518 RepID=A0A9D1PHT8_9FIRM|nr:DNA repair protein RecN [Candidatus Butyricicoccus avistercoris]